MPKIKNIQRELATTNDIKELIVPKIIKDVEKDYTKWGENFEIDDKIGLYEQNTKGLTATKITITFDEYEQEKPIVTEKGIFIKFNTKLKTLTLFSVFHIAPNDKEEINHAFYHETYELVNGELIDITKNDLLFNIH